jgi:hypothetical protein
VRAEHTIEIVPGITPVEAGYCPDTDFCTEMGGCMSGCSSGPGVAPETDTAVMSSTAGERVEDGPVGFGVVDDTEMADAVDFYIGGAVKG